MTSLWSTYAMVNKIEKIKKPKASDFKNHPAGAMHSAMQNWANKAFQWKVCIVNIEFKDGSSLEWCYDQATKEVEYKVEGETYSVDVPLLAKFKYDNSTIIGPTDILERDQAFAGDEAEKIEINCKNWEDHHGTGGRN